MRRSPIMAPQVRAPNAPRGVERSRPWKGAAGALLALALLAGLGGCAPTIYTLNVMPAARAVHQAEEAGAPTHAPYEYYYARAHLDQAREDAGEASYQDAIRNAKIAEEYGVKALDLARRRLREQGR